MMKVEQFSLVVKTLLTLSMILCLHGKAIAKKIPKLDQKHSYDYNLYVSHYLSAIKSVNNDKYDMVIH